MKRDPLPPPYSLFSLVSEIVRVSRLDFPESLRPSGVEGAAGVAAGGGEAGGAPAWAAWCGQPVDGLALSWPVHGDGGDGAGEQGQ